MLVNDDEEKDELRVSKNIRVSLDFGLVRWSRFISVGLD